jgi:N-acetylmuramoyl-L-alanine amidase
MVESYPLGSRIRHAMQDYGTAGCLASFPAFPDRILLLTASHVLAPHGVDSNDLVYLNDPTQPYDQAGTVCGKLYCWTGLDPAGTTADAALAWIDPFTISPAIPGIGIPTGINETPKVGDALNFFGSTSGLVKGMKILALAQDVTFNVGPADNAVAYRYNQQIFCDFKTQAGDSGAAVLDASGQIVGLVTGWASVDGFGAVTVVCPISAIRRHKQWNGQVLNILGPIPDTAKAPPPPDQQDVMARTIYGEARGEKQAGMEDVACVIMNRLAISTTAAANGGEPYWWGADINGICKAPGQFSCWNIGDPNRDVLLAVTPSDQAFVQCQQVASNAIAGGLVDRTGGATHYKVTTLPWPKDWGRQVAPTFVEGNHSFYIIH